MKIIIALAIISFQFVSDHAVAQSNEDVSKTIDDLNRALDQAVVNQDILTLNKHYGEDFVFTHGTGLVDSKESWINNIKKLGEENRFISREHDSTHVELHDDVAIIVGTLTVARLSKQETQKYALRYVRVYVLRNKVWQLISHRTTKEWHL
jgi:ketosteroid isomerase-like protein